jgi:hypothetical protein
MGWTEKRFRLAYVLYSGSLVFLTLLINPINLEVIRKGIKTGICPIQWQSCLKNPSKLIVITLCYRKADHRAIEEP